MVYYHRIGTPQSADELVFRDEKNPQRFHTLGTTEDERFAVLDVSDRGTGKKGNAVFVQDLSKPGTTFTPLIPEIGDDSYNVLENVGGELLVFTDNNAPNGRVVRIDPTNPAPANWKMILAEKPDTDRLDRGRRRQGDRHLHEGRGLEGLRPQPRRRARERDRAAGARQRRAASAATWTTRRCSTRSRRSTIRRRSSATTSRRERARCSARRRFPDSTSISTRPSRSSSPARTARRCRCSWSTRRASSSTATTRRCCTATAASTSRPRRASTRCGWRCSSRASFTPASTCAAAANTARSGTRPARS